MTKGHMIGRSCLETARPLSQLQSSAPSSRVRWGVFSHRSSPVGSCNWRGSLPRVTKCEAPANCQPVFDAPRSHRILDNLTALFASASEGRPKGKGEKRREKTTAAETRENPYYTTMDIIGYRPRKGRSAMVSPHPHGSCCHCYNIGEALTNN